MRELPGMKNQLTGGINLLGGRGAQPLVRDLHTPCGQANHIIQTVTSGGLQLPPAALHMQSDPVIFTRCSRSQGSVSCPSDKAGTDRPESVTSWTRQGRGAHWLGFSLIRLGLQKKLHFCPQFIQNLFQCSHQLHKTWPTIISTALVRKLWHREPRQPVLALPAGNPQPAAQSRHSSAGPPATTNRGPARGN